MTRRLSRGELLEELLRLSEEVDGTPTTRQMGSRGRYSVGPYRRVFGSWTEALEAAGMSAPQAGRLSREELEEELLRLSEEVGGTPTREQMDRVGEYSSTVYAGRWGSWNAAVEEFGLAPNRELVDDDVDKEDLFQQIDRLAEGDTPPTLRELETSWPYPRTIYASVGFDTWNDALRAAGYAPRPPRRGSI